MKINLLSSLLRKSSAQLMIFWRYLKFVFIRKKIIKDDFLIIQKDFSFSNSLIYIEFYFKNLIFISISGIDKKLYNGRVVLNSDNIKYPISIKVITGNGKFYYTVESPDCLGFILNSKRYLISQVKNNYLKSFKSRSINLKRVNTKFSDSSIIKKQSYSTEETFMKLELKKLNITINHNQFKTNENL